MDSFSAELNTLLTTTYRYIVKVEEAMLKNLSRDQLSISEMHMLESVGKGRGEGRSVTAIAQENGVTLPTVTMGINKLVKKGYVTKDRVEGDKRMVCVRLTDAGRRAETAHRFFHRQMVKAIGGAIREDEQPTLLKSLLAMQEFLRKKVDEIEAHQGIRIGPDGGQIT